MAARTGSMGVADPVPANLALCSGSGRQARVVLLWPGEAIRPDQTAPGPRAGSRPGGGAARPDRGALHRPMKHRTSPRFRACYNALPAEVRQLADRCHAQLCRRIRGIHPCTSRRWGRTGRCAWGCTTGPWGSRAQQRIRPCRVQARARPNQQNPGRPRGQRLRPQADVRGRTISPPGE